MARVDFAAGHEDCFEELHEDEGFVAREDFVVDREDSVEDREDFVVACVIRSVAYELLGVVDVVLEINVLDRVEEDRVAPEYEENCMGYEVTVMELDSVMEAPLDLELAVAPSGYFAVMVKPSLFILNH